MPEKHIAYRNDIPTTERPDLREATHCTRPFFVQFANYGYDRLPDRYADDAACTEKTAAGYGREHSHFLATWYGYGWSCIIGIR